MASEQVTNLAAQVAALTPAKKLRLAADLLEQGAAPLAHTIVRAAEAELAVALLPRVPR